MTASNTPSVPLKRRLKIWRKRIYFGWKMRTWPWHVPPGVAFISTKRPPEWVFEHARRRSEAEGWKDIVP